MSNLSALDVQGMRELSVSELDLVSGGGDMSTETKVIVGLALVVSPLLGAVVLIGYYANRE